MGVEVRLKTGFFETTHYHLEIKDKRLYFLPIDPESGAKIIIREGDILSVTLQVESLQFEIATDSFLYHGVFISNKDWTQIIHLFKSKLNTKIICEYEGGLISCLKILRESYH